MRLRFPLSPLALLIAAAQRTDATAWNPFPYTFKVVNNAVVAGTAKPKVLPPTPDVSAVAPWVAGRRCSRSTTEVAPERCRIAGDVRDGAGRPVEDGVDDVGARAAAELNQQTV